VSQRTKDLIPITTIQSLVFNPLCKADDEVDEATETGKFHRPALSKMPHEITQCFEVPARRFSRRLRTSTATTKGEDREDVQFMA
jgi:hypothetical protein